MRKIRILFVCMGNICRSPLAHAVFLDAAEKAGVSDRFEVESCGTGAWHVGNLPDARMRAEAQKHGIVMDHRARVWHSSDGDYFDIILPMDRVNLAEILLRCDEAFHGKIRLFRTYDPQATDANDEVPDPYHGGAKGFSLVYDIVERTIHSLLAGLLQGEF